MGTLIMLQHRFLSETIKGLDQQRREIEERQREVEEDLALASRLQQTMFQHQSHLYRSENIPASLPYKLYYLYQPATLVGGDFFHTFPLTDGLIGVLLCDVMGHGVRSALVTAMIRALAETHIKAAGDPCEFLIILNRDLFLLLQETDDQLFATALYLLLDIHDGLVRYAVAGHHDPLQLTRKELLFIPLTAEQSTGGPPLGIVEDFTYGTNVSPFASGDLFLLYTDGLFEVFSPDGEEFGQERLLTALQELCLLTMPVIFDEIMAKLETFAGKNNFPDYICLIGLEVSVGN
jgi:serine phosphatase RsbU (regulator of sigma subunit)